MIACTPPMGWNSWDCYGAAVTEETVRRNADYMAAHLKSFTGIYMPYYEYTLTSLLPSWIWTVSAAWSRR